MDQTTLFTRRLTQGALASAACLLASTSHGVIIDDFESYTPGDVDVVATPTWTAEYAGSSAIVSDAGNQYITYQGNGDWEHTYRQSPVSIDTTGSFSFDVYVDTEDTAPDHAIGMSNSAQTIDWYGDYGPYVRVTDDTAGSTGVVSLDVRDGGGFVDDIATLNIGQWYTVTLDIDTSGSGSFDVSVDGIGTVYSNAGFRFAYDGNPLDVVLLMGGNGAGQTVRVDNLNVVPEPASLALIALGGLTALRRRKNA